MPFTYTDAKKMVGDSMDWRVGIDVSIKKWEQIASGDTESYSRGNQCGCCFVRENRGEGCLSCPAESACSEVVFKGTPAENILQALYEIEVEKE